MSVTELVLAKAGRPAPFVKQDQSLAVIYERANIGIAEVDSDGKLVRVNPHLAGLWGYPAEELLGRSIFDPMLTEAQEADQAQFQRQVRGEINCYTIEKRFRCRDGSKLWITDTSTTVHDDRGRFLYAVRVQHDITARKVAEQELTQRAEQQAALYEFTDTLQRVVSLDGAYDPALAAIVRALDCERASILLLDDAGIMKFVAWRGLSESAPWRGIPHGPPARPMPGCASVTLQRPICPST
jgi:PAS domain S-box-containing protein